MRRNKKSQFRQDEERIVERLSRHVCLPRTSRSFDFSEPGKGRMYAYALTWTPGVLTLAGDLGEMTLTHYSALAAPLQSALEWATTSDLHYLLGKSDKKESYDRDATVQYIVQHCNESAVEGMHGFRERMREWREEGREIEAEIADAEAEGEPLEDAEKMRANWEKDQPKLEIATRRDPLSYKNVEDAPEGFETWNKLRKHLSEWRDENDIFTRAGRREIIEELDCRCSTVEGAYEVAVAIGLDDFYGSYGWTYQDIAQVTAIRMGAVQALKVVREENNRLAVRFVRCAFRVRRYVQGLFKPPQRPGMIVYR